MDTARDALPDDITALKEALIIERAKALEVAAELAVARAKASEDVALIAQQKLRIAKLERQVYGQRSERSARLIDQLALAFEELQAGATEDELAAETAVAKTMSVRGFTRKRPERNTFPDHLPRERVVIDPPTACECCGGNRLRKRAPKLYLHSFGSGKLIDISIAGLGLLTSAPIALEERVRIRLQHDIRRFVKEVRGVVRWTQLTDAGKFRLGIVLHSRLSSLDIQLLNQLGAGGESGQKVWV